MPLYGPLAAYGRLGAAQSRYEIGATDIREQIELMEAAKKAAEKQEKAGLRGGLGGLLVLAALSAATGGATSPLLATKLGLSGAAALAAGGGSYVGRRGARTPMPKGMFRQEQRRQLGEELRGREVSGAVDMAKLTYLLGSLGTSGSFMDLLRRGGQTQAAQVAPWEEYAQTRGGFTL